MTGTARIIRGDALRLPLADQSVDLIVTSPPYLGLRSYQDGGEHYAGQIGAEPTPTEFVDALIAATREMVRVLKPSGSIFVNLGDKYSGSGVGGPQNGKSAKINTPKNRVHGKQGRMPVTNVPAKSLIGIPWRYAIRCIDELGLILRAEIIWSKPNGLPESVTDRVRRSHETWFHFTVHPRYFSAMDEIREGYAPGTAARYAAGYSQTHAVKAGQTANGVLRVDEGGPSSTNPLGKPPGSVWSIPTQPLRVPPELGIDHFAAFPMEWPRRFIQGWSPAGLCTACGEGRRPIATKAADGKVNDPANWSETVMFHDRGKGGIAKTPFQRGVTTTITGYACGCPETTAPTTPAVVLDPFSGTGTTALVAKMLGRSGIGVDMSADYCRLAEWRTTDPAQMAKAAEMDAPPPPQPEEQMALWA